MDSGFFMSEALNKFFVKKLEFLGQKNEIRI